MLLAQRNRVHTGDVKLTEQRDHISADECHVEVAGPGPVVVKRLVRLSPFMPGDRAAAKDYFDSIRSRIAQCLDEFVVLGVIAVECKPDHPLTNCVLAFFGHTLSFSRDGPLRKASEV